MSAATSTSNAARYALHCNQTYAHSLASPEQSMPVNPGPPPTKHVAIVTCMDARLDVFRMFGLEIGEAHVIRVGGGRTPDALRSLVASEHVLGTKEVMVVHHTDCGFTKAPSEDMVRKEVRASLGGLAVGHFAFMPITEGLEQSVKDDVEFLRQNPYIRKDAEITGWIYETTKGTIQQVNA